MREGKFDYVDVMGERITGERRLEVRRIVLGGRLWHEVEEAEAHANADVQGHLHLCLGSRRRGCGPCWPRVRDAGLNTLTLAAGYHAGKFLRPHGVSGKVYFPKDGTVYFRARPERYGRIKPVTRRRRASDPLADLAQGAPDLGRVAWVVACHNTPLGSSTPTRRPQLLRRSVPLQPVPGASGGPRLRRESLRGSRRPHRSTGVALETPGWLPYEHGYHHEFAMLPLDRWAKSLLACASQPTRRAAKAADIDADRLQAKARALLERCFAADLALPEAMAAECWLADMVATPTGAPSSLALPGGRRSGRRGEGRAAGRHPACRDPLRPAPHGGAWIEGSDLALLAGSSDALEIWPTRPALRRCGWMWDVRRRVGDDARLHFILRPGFPDLAGGGETTPAARP